ncbi:hypothetical protein RHGRI_029372 [Rhododendron griersonianum]|uniref:Uncharacterized protein n=1 Tax=Rhododendron griersonianum TaxID=479676 RepID=A0AAV6INR5_9ERIC|nr:hypothetical protein RHGRI_029372 [Rhododendron griersonianum]
MKRLSLTFPFSLSLSISQRSPSPSLEHIHRRSRRENPPSWLPSFLDFSSSPSSGAYQKPSSPPSSPSPSPATAASFSS